VALGASSISSVGKTYTQNSKDIQDYTQDRAFPKWEKALLMDEEDELRRDIIIDLFCNFYLDFKTVEQKHHIDFKTHFKDELDRLADYEKEGLLKSGDRHMAVTGLGRLFIRNICMTFDTYIRKDRGKRYSKTF
jgi:oxygen-independent coproporphyrinogen-3 oxidase